MAVVVSIARGHDASYPFRTIGAADGATVTGQRGAGYYLSAVEKGGEPAGIWIGGGAAGLGLRDGDAVRREDFEPLYGQFLDKRGLPLVALVGGDHRDRDAGPLGQFPLAQAGLQPGQLQQRRRGRRQRPGSLWLCHNTIV